VPFDPRLVEPFWRSSTMYRESLFFVDRGEGLATATLLFPHAERVSLTSATGDVAFESGRDYNVDSTTGLVSVTPGSRIPFATLDELYFASDPFVLIADGGEFHRRQISASYSHVGDEWQGVVPQPAGTQLPRTFRRLSSSQPLVVCITGDSISEGYNASGFTGLPPFQPPYTELVANGIERQFGSQVTPYNFAAAGWTSDHGLADADRAAAAQPDLTIVAFGMNDAGYAEAAAFAANVSGIMTAVRAGSPESEFILVSPMLPNPRWPYPVEARFPAYRDALAELCGSGTALADVTSIWTDMLARKSVHDLTGNGINHPNDFGHRVYAQVILALLASGTSLPTIS